MIRAARLLLAFARPPARLRESEIRIPCTEDDRPATLLRPPTDAPAPAWIVLQGLTVYGRRHPSLLRFARALCSTGATVLVPEIPEWTALRIRTGAVVDAVACAAEYLGRHHPGSDGGVGLVGFSFGATQGIVAAAAERNRDRVRTVVGFGGYAEMPRFARFMMTGEHEWEGTSYRVDPDPYARWIVAGNYLTRVPGMEGMERVRELALELALEAGRGGLGQPDAYMDPFKAERRARLDAGERAVWDLLASPTARTHADTAAAAELGRLLGEAALTADPLLDPRSALADLRAHLLLAHGFSDRLIPFTETLRLARAVPPRVRSRVAVTRLFEHSLGARGLRRREFPAEGWRLLRFLDAALGP